MVLYAHNGKVSQAHCDPVHRVKPSAHIVYHNTAGEERSALYKTLVALRRQRPASGRGPVQLLTCARVTALCLSFMIGLLLVLATRHPPVQEVLKGGVQKAGELLQNVRTPVEVKNLAQSHEASTLLVLPLLVTVLSD